MFISNFNRLACRFLESFDLKTAPSVCIFVGTTGLGKTTFLKHLFQRAEKQAEHPLYIEAQKFATKYAFAASHRELSSFRKYFRSSKFLVLDNIDLLYGKTKTIEELFHTLETILAQGGKVVISYGGNDLCLDFLGKRFASRLESGLIIRLQQPTPKEMNDFLEYYLRDLDQLNLLESVELSKAVNIREIINLVDYIRPGYSAETDSLSENGELKLKKDIPKVLALVSEQYLSDAREILGNSKKKNHVQARYMMYLLLHEQFAYPYPEISHFFKKNLKDLQMRCVKVREGKGDLFETLCQKLYNERQ